MKQKIILSFSVLALLVVVAFMVKDFFYSSNKSASNPYSYDLDKLKQIDSSKIGYVEVGSIMPDIETLKAIAIGTEDKIYIAGKSKILVFDRLLNEVQSFNTEVEAQCMAVGSNIIYLGVKGDIVSFDLLGNPVARWNAINSKSNITSIAVSENHIYAADAGNRIVYQLNSTGEVVREIGAKDASKGIAGFIIPSPYFDLLVGTFGELWVVNPGRHSLEKYNESGELVSSWTRTSMGLDGFSGCCNPSHIAMLSDGSFVTSEKGIERVKVHSPTGDFKTVVATPSTFNEGTKGIDLAVDSEDRIFVLDPVKKVVRVFREKSFK